MRAPQVDAALALWDLEHFELFWERSLDTKAVVGWNEDTVRAGQAAAGLAGRGSSATCSAAAAVLRRGSVTLSPALPSVPPAVRSHRAAGGDCLPRHRQVGAQRSAEWHEALSLRGLYWWCWSLRLTYSLSCLPLLPPLQLQQRAV